MSSKRVTVSFSTSPRKYESMMMQAKSALAKVKDAGIDNGEVTIDHITIKIENLSGGK